MANAAITVDLNARIAQFETELKRATGTLDKFGQRGNAIATGLKSAFAGMAAGLSVGALAAFAKQGIDAADALNDMSQRLGVSVKDLASLKLAAEQSGTSLDSVGTGIARLSKSIGEAEGGNKQMAKSLAELKITARDPKEAFFQLADAVQRIQDPTKRAALLSDVLGKSYGELVPLLAQGGTELRKSAQASESFAETMARLAPDADKFNDQLSTLKQNAAAAAAEGLIPLVEGLNRTMAAFGVLGRLHDSGASLGEILKSTYSADLADSIKKVNDQIRITEKELSLSPKGNFDPFGERDALEAELSRLKSIRAALRKESMDSAMALAEQQYKKNEKLLVSPKIDLSAAAKTPKPAKGIDKLDFFNDEMARNAKLVADETERIAGDFAFMRDVDLEQNNPIAALKQEWIDAGAALHDSMKTPLESLEERLAYIDELMRRNVISVEDYGRAYATALDEGNTKAEKTKSLAEEIGLSFTSAFEDAIAKGEDFGDVLNALEQDIVKLLTRKAVTEPLMGMFEGIDLGAIFSNFLPSAKGNVFSGAGISAYSGSVVSKPTVFPFATGIGLMGEAGAEAILPLKRGPDGKLGVEGGGASVQVNVINNAAGTQATTSERSDSNGNRIIDVMIDQVKNAMAGDVARGGTFSSAMERTYGLSRAPGAF